MNAIQEIRTRTIENINKIQSLYVANTDKNYRIEHQSRIEKIKQIINKSAKKKNTKAELDLLLKAIESANHLLNFKHEFNDTDNLETLQNESNLISIKFGFLYLDYCFNNGINLQDIEDTIENFLSGLQIISSIFLVKSKCLYNIEKYEIEKMTSFFQDLIFTAKKLREAAIKCNFNYEKFLKLDCKSLEIFRSIYSCLFILKEIKRERQEFKSKNQDFNKLEIFESKKRKIHELIYSCKEQNPEEEKEVMKSLIETIDNNRYRNFIEE